MKENFDKAIAFTLSWEGGYSNDPKDAGGETNRGISKRAYPNLDIKNLTKEQAIAIYKADYWNKCDCDNMTYPLDIICFDTAVNMGVSRALIFKKQTTDYRDYILLRIQRYLDLAAKNPTFLKGWLNRTLALYNLVKGH